MCDTNNYCRLYFCRVGSPKPLSEWVFFVWMADRSFWKSAFVDATIFGGRKLKTKHSRSMFILSLILKFTYRTLYLNIYLILWNTLRSETPSGRALHSYIHDHHLCAYGLGQPTHNPRVRGARPDVLDITEGVGVDNTLSAERAIASQGSVLGPLIFYVYINGRGQVARSQIGHVRRRHSGLYRRSSGLSLIHI